MRMASFGTIFVPAAIFIMREEILQWKGRDTTSHADLQTVSPLAHLRGAGQERHTALLVRDFLL